MAKKNANEELNDFANMATANHMTYGQWQAKETLSQAGKIKVPKGYKKIGERAKEKEKKGRNS